VPHGDEKFELIRSVPIFAYCDEDEVEALAKAADLVEVPAGMELVTQGKHTNEFVVIAQGAADVSRDGKVIDKMGSGQFFGEVALLTGAPRNATVTATAPSTLLVLSDRAFHQVAEHLPGVQMSVLKALADRLHTETV
jgi:CRP-like cAMP-binding protein